MATSGELMSPSASFGMDPRRWKRIEELFHQATELPMVERTEFVVVACGEDEPLAQEVFSLLAFHDEADRETLLEEMRSLVQERRLRMQAEGDAEAEQSG